MSEEKQQAPESTLSTLTANSQENMHELSFKNTLKEEAEMTLPAPVVDGEKRDLEAEAEKVAPGDAPREKTVLEKQAEGHLHGAKLWAVYGSMLLSVFLISLDQTILAPALPVIASKFQSLDQIGWIASGFFLTQAPFMLFWGAALTITRTKTVFMLVIALFEIGSLLCGVAPNVNVLILGRAIAGVGAGGIFVSVLNIIAQISPLEMRPLLMAGFGLCFAGSSIIGPLLGGVFTDHVSWRWCFYINLPIGAITIGTIFWFLKPLPSPAELDEEDNRSILARWKSLDWAGMVLVLGATVCLVLALSWGGNTKPWSSPAVIACLVVFGVLVPTIVGWSYYMKTNALIPLHYFKNRTVSGGIVAAFMLFLTMLGLIYYLPLQYQAVRHDSATASGIAILPFMMSVVAGSLIAGGVAAKTGHYWEFMVIPPLIFSAVGGGLFWTVTAQTSNAALSGYQWLVGFGVGMAMQQGMLAVQAEYNQDQKALPQATALLSFFQLLGGVIGISICQTLFAGGLSKAIAPLGLDAALVDTIKATTEVIYTLSQPTQGQVIDAYVYALRQVYIIAVPAAILSAIGALFVKRHNIKEMGLEMGGGA